MRDNDNKLIWEQYQAPGRVQGSSIPFPDGRGEMRSPTEPSREYGPSGAPSLDVSTWKLQDWYTLDEWENSTDGNSWVKYTMNVIDDLQDRVLDGDGEPGRSYVAFFGAPQGTADYEAWTDPGIVVAFNNSQEKFHGGIDFSKGIFVDNDGDGESHVLSTDMINQMVNANEDEIRKRFESDEQHQTWDPYGPEGVASRSDFY